MYRISEILSKECRVGLGGTHQSRTWSKPPGWLATDQRPWSSIRDAEQVVPVQHIIAPQRRTGVLDQLPNYLITW
jgi:hypothetical protein